MRQYKPILISNNDFLINAMMRLIYYANMQNKPKIKKKTYQIEIKSESSAPCTVCPNIIVIIMIIQI